MQEYLQEREISLLIERLPKRFSRKGKQHIIKVLSEEKSKERILALLSDELNQIGLRLNKTRERIKALRERESELSETIRAWVLALNLEPKGKTPRLRTDEMEAIVAPTKPKLIASPEKLIEWINTHIQEKPLGDKVLAQCVTVNWSKATKALSPFTDEKTLRKDLEPEKKLAKPRVLVKLLPKEGREQK